MPKESSLTHETEVKYFEMYPNTEELSWELSLPWLNEDNSWKDVWQYSRCEMSSSAIVEVEIAVPGKAVDYNVANFNAIIVSEEFASVCKEFASNDIQLIATTLSGTRKWFCMNILQQVDCIDRKRSIIDYAEGTTNVVKGVRKLMIRHENFGHNIFRVTGWTVCIVVSEVLRNAILGRRLTGVIFIPV